MLSILYLRCWVVCLVPPSCGPSCLSILYLRCGTQGVVRMDRQIHNDLSILYLRCSLHESVKRGDIHCVTFNSLFEMREEPHAGAPFGTDTLSILYLRCDG